MRSNILLILFCFLLVGCSSVASQAADGIEPKAPIAQPTISPLPNPASAFCVQQGYKVEIRAAPDGSQTGYCLFPDGSECDEWAYFRGKCSPANQSSAMHNPASAYCEKQGYQVEIRTDEDGNQSGFCLFPGGSACDEWAYFRGECLPTSGEKPSDSSTSDPERWELYTNQVLGYAFQYPYGAQVSTNDNPLKSLSITGSVMGTETWTISHPSDRGEYLPPENVDLLQFLMDHNLVGENPQPDEQIGGTTAIHFRHERSPQSYAADIYYFANAGQLYQIIIGHSSDIEDWALNESFLQSFSFLQPASSISPAPMTTAVPIDPAAYQDWITYTHPVYNFTIRLPVEWIVEEVADGGPGMNGHILSLHSVDQYSQENIRLTFRLLGEDVLLWPTGVGQGDFVPQGTLIIDGEPAQRMALVCPTGEVTAIWYYQSAEQPNLARGELEFGIIYSATPVHCKSGLSLGSTAQLMGEMIIASLHVH
jgi:putative hemolysin